MLFAVLLLEPTLLLDLSSEFTGCNDDLLNFLGVGGDVMGVTSNLRPVLFLFFLISNSLCFH